MTAKLAILIDRYHLSLEEIAGLTDYQIVRLYFHKRDKDGVIKFPEAVVVGPNRPDTEDEALMVLNMMANLMKPDDLEAAKQKVKEKFKEERGTGERPEESGTG